MDVSLFVSANLVFSGFRFWSRWCHFQKLFERVGFIGHFEFIVRTYWRNSKRREWEKNNSLEIRFRWSAFPTHRNIHPRQRFVVVMDVSDRDRSPCTLCWSISLAWTPSRTLCRARRCQLLRIRCFYCPKSWEHVVDASSPGFFKWKFIHMMCMRLFFESCCCCFFFFWVSTFKVKISKKCNGTKNYV